MQEVGEEGRKGVEKGRRKSGREGERGKEGRGGIVRERCGRGSTRPGDGGGIWGGEAQARRMSK